MSAAATSDRKGDLLSPGKRIQNRLEVVAKLGEGAQAVVYRAKDTTTGELVALKVIHRHLLGDPQIFKRFHREAAILKHLEGEHLVRFIEFIEDDSLLMIALEHVEAQSLEDILIEQKSIPMKDAIEITIQVCAALGVAHAASVVHRDLKPANVLIETGGAGGALRVRVVDFGLAKVLHGEHMTTGLTEQDMIFGTPEYMAPEQARGEDADLRSDIYAAGCMLYEMAVGRVPFKGRTPLATMTAHLSQEVPPPRSSNPGRGITPALEAVISRALSKACQDRYASAREFAEALAAARDQGVVITPMRVDERDAASISTSDTDLSVSTTGILNEPTMESEPEGIHRPQVRVLPPVEVIAAPPEPPKSRVPRRNEMLLWIMVAVVAAVIGIAIGTLAGTR